MPRNNRRLTTPQSLNAYLKGISDMVQGRSTTGFSAYGILYDTILIQKWYH